MHVAIRFDVLDTGTEVNERAAEQKEPRSF